jgi:glutathione peroxidase
MKFPYSIIVFLSSCFGFKTEVKNVQQTNAVTSFYDLSFKDIDGQPVDLNTFKGKPILIVNTASKCGFTPQFEELESFYKTYKNQAYVIGVPCNDFGNQDPGQEAEIKSFCQRNYGVTFLMTEKMTIKESPSPLYKWLTSKTENGWNEQKPSWNFCKYIISADGQLVAFYGSAVKPHSDEIKKAMKLK